MSLSFDNIGMLIALVLGAIGLAGVLVASIVYCYKNVYSSASYKYYVDPEYERRK